MTVLTQPFHTLLISPPYMIVYVYTCQCWKEDKLYDNFFLSYRRLLAAHSAACFKINLWKFITTYIFDGSKIQCQSSSHHNGITLDRYQMSLSHNQQVSTAHWHSGCRYVQLRRLHMQFKKASIMGRVTATAVIAVNAIRVMIMPVITLTFKLE